MAPLTSAMISMAQRLPLVTDAYVSDGVSAPSVLVLGNAETLPDDYARARLLRPDADIIAVNNACRFKRPDHLFSLHPEKMAVWKNVCLSKWGQLPWCHGAKRAKFAAVDCWWPDASGQGSSGWSAAKLAQLLGYGEVILCGVPLAPMPYHRRGPAKAFTNRKILEHYRNGVSADTAWHSPVRSMSGWTKQLLGTIE